MSCRMRAHCLKVAGALFARAYRMGCDGVKMLKDFVLVLVSSVCSKCQRFNQKKVDNTAWRNRYVLNVLVPGGLEKLQAEPNFRLDGK